MTLVGESKRPLCIKVDLVNLYIVQIQSDSEGDREERTVTFVKME